MRRYLIRFLLGLLNSRWLNPTPCRYEYVGNVDDFSIENLRAEESQRPGITVATIIREAEAFKSCPIGPHGLVVMEDGVARPGTIWDIHELRQAIAEKKDAG